MNRFYGCLFVLTGASALAKPASPPTPAAQSAPRPIVTVEPIMQDPKDWIGTSPSNPFWSDDSRTLYFNWNPTKATDSPAQRDSLYKVTLTPGKALPGKALTASQPMKVSPAERRTLPTAPVLAYNRARTQRLFERQGDLFLLDVRSGKIRQLTNTVDPETEPIFSGDGQSVVFRRSGLNVFTLNLQTGERTQLTDCRVGLKRN